MLNRRKVGMTSNHHGLYAWGCKRATMVGTVGSDTARWSEPQKPGPSPDWGLQLAPMNVGIASNRRSERSGEYVPEPCTHRPSSHPSWVHPKSLLQPAKEEGAEGESGKGD